jgi:valyl-tRNA synthetase
LKELVGACRALRSEMGLSPAQRVPLVLAGDPDQLAHFSPYLPALAKVSAVNIVDDLPETDAPTALVGETRLMLHIEVDAAAERQRIGKELAGAETERGGLSARLANEQFVVQGAAAGRRAGPRASRQFADDDRSTAGATEATVGLTAGNPVVGSRRGELRGSCHEREGRRVVE